MLCHTNGATKKHQLRHPNVNLGAGQLTVSLSLKQLSQHTLVMIEYIIYAPEDFAEEAGEFIGFEDKGVGV